MPGVELTRYFHKNANCLAIPFDREHEQECITLLTNEMSAGKFQTFEMDHQTSSDSYQIIYRYKDESVAKAIGAGYMLALFSDGKYDSMPKEDFLGNYSTNPPENYAAVVGTAVVGG